MKRTRRIFYVALVAALLALVAFSPTPIRRWSSSGATTLAWPFLKLTCLARDRVSATVQFLTDQRVLRVQNALLKKKVEELSADRIKWTELLAENERLKNLLEFRRLSSPRTVAARVMGYDPSGWTQSLWIDKGASHNIRANQAVVCPEGVVGKIAQVGPIASNVLLVVDRHIRVGAMLENSRDAGILEGCGPGRCRVLYLPKETLIELGQKVLTSGLGGIFPKGLLLGKVVGVGLDELGLYQYADVEPAVPISKLEEVLILETSK